MRTENDHLKWFAKTLPPRFFTEQMRMVHLKSGGQIVASLSLLFGKSYVEFFFGSSANDATHEGTILGDTQDTGEALERVLASLRRKKLVPEAASVG